MYWRVHVFHSLVIMQILFLVVNLHTLEITLQLTLISQYTLINIRKIKLSTVISDDEQLIINNIWSLLLVKSNQYSVACARI